MPKWPFLKGTQHICLLGLLPPPRFQSPGIHCYFCPPFCHPKEGIVPLAWLKQEEILQKPMKPATTARSGYRAKNHDTSLTEILRNTSFHRFWY